VSLDFKSTEWGRKFEWPQEVVGFLEFWTTGDNFMDEILNTSNTVFAELSFNDAVVSEWKSSSLNFTTSSLVDELANGLSRWVSIGNEWLNHLDHVPCGFVELNENSIV